MCRAGPWALFTHMVALTLLSLGRGNYHQKQFPKAVGALQSLTTACGASLHVREGEVWIFVVLFSLRASSKPRWVDGECRRMLADKAKWLKTLPFFGSLSPNPNENRHRGKPGAAEGEDSRPSAVGTGAG